MRVTATIPCNDIIDMEGELRVTFEYTQGSNGYLSGLPEDCYPDEPDIYEVETVHFKTESHCIEITQLMDIPEIEAHILNELEKLQQPDPDDADHYDPPSEEEGYFL